MPNSGEYQQYKTLYYEKNLPIIDLSKDEEKASIIFKDGNSEIEIAGSSADFVHEVSALVPTIKNGLEQYIELKETRFGTVQDYQKAINYFKSESDQPVRKAALAVNNDETTLPEDMNLREALNATIRDDFNNPELKKIVDYYYESIALLNSDITKLENAYQKIHEKNIYDKCRAVEYNLQAETILEHVYGSLPPFASYKQFTHNTNTDIQYFAERLLSSRNKNIGIWEALQSEKSRNEHDHQVLFQKTDQRTDSQSNEVGQVAAEFGVELLLNQYEDFFELIREPLTDIAIALSSPKQDFNNFREVYGYLERNDAQFFTEGIEPQLRHGPAHNQVELNDSAGMARFYSSRAKGRELIKKIPYDEIPEYYYALIDLIFGLLKAFNEFERHISLRYLSSTEFQYRVIANMNPEVFNTTGG